MDNQERYSRRRFLKKFGLLVGGLFIPDWIEDKQPRIKTPEELEVEKIIEKGYQSYLRGIIIQGRELLIRIPFGQWGERFKNQPIFRGGKADPEILWQEIEKVLFCPHFAQYQEALSQPGEKLILFDVAKRTYQVFTKETKIAQIKTYYKGNNAFPYEIKKDSFISAIDIYNYLYCLRGLGVDCSGFAFYLQKLIASHYGVNLQEEIAKEFNRDPKSLVIGTWYYRFHGQRVDDKIINLRAGDIILFPDRKRPVVHSAVIQSIDFLNGKIRYVQCTDWVFDRSQRGPHESEIIFDPDFPEKSLKDPSLNWTKRLGADFENTPCPYGNETDGFRYRLIPYQGKVVRLPKKAAAAKVKSYRNEPTIRFLF